MVELLSPVGDFECLKAAVQNGANAVYFGANLFSARAFAKNFNLEELEQAINYAKLRNVKTHLTLNTLIKNCEFEDAFNLAKKAYELGIDAIIVQDLGLAKTLINSFPDLDIHASTQMTNTNLEAVKKLKELGFKRVVLSRECSLSEIEHICKNSNIEIEVFIHGALCISYSGQCLFSSMVGGRSGNRGQCAQPCRLPYSLEANSQTLDNGYLLSPRDLCSLEKLPELIKAGVTSFKIEGRMKSPIYVATVTRIYRKYIDLSIKYINNEIPNYYIDEKDMQDLIQVFNRGNFSKGHLLDEPNKDLIFKNKPNNMGIYLGMISKYNPSKGLVTVSLNNNVSIGDGISFENENTKYTISELMINNKNIKTGLAKQIVTFGRMKGNIKVGDKIYKLSDKELSTNALESFNGENIKNPLYCKLDISPNEAIKVYIKHENIIEDSFVYDYIPEVAKNAPITSDKVKTQFNKTLNTCFEFTNIDICINGDVFIPTSILNNIRRQAISCIEAKIIKSFKKTSNYKFEQNYIKTNSECKKSLLLNILNLDYDYTNLKNVNRIYIPLKYFSDKKFENIIHTLSKKSNLYIYMPVIVKDRFVNNIHHFVNNAIKNFDIKGFVVSEISSLEFLKQFNLDLIANYNFNIFNSYTAYELEKLGFSTITLSPELDKSDFSSIFSASKEVIVYGKIPLMTMSYCILGKSNRCYDGCKHLCNSNNTFYLNDRYNFKFRIIPDNTQTLTTIYNSRNISISDIKSCSTRVDILDETIDEINEKI